MTAGRPPLRVVIADDQALVRTGFKMILAADGIEVTAEAADGAKAAAAVRRTRPDVVLMDIRMPEMDGIEATRRILGSDGPQETRVVILTTYDPDHYVYAALTAGASGFLLRTSLRNTWWPPCTWCSPAMLSSPPRSPAG